MKIKKVFFITFYSLIMLCGAVWLYSNSLLGVHKQSKIYYARLKSELKKQGYKPRLFVISGRRFDWDNYLMSRFGGAAKNSKHKLGQAIDVIVLDVNNDGNADTTDVNIVYEILNHEIIQNAGGLGVYKKETGFLGRQMVHFDCRGTRARWSR